MTTSSLGTSNSLVVRSARSCTEPTWVWVSRARIVAGEVPIDLGVFSDNPGAQALYVRHDFQVVGRTPDRFRVDGQSLDDTSMTLNVAGVDD